MIDSVGVIMGELTEDPDKLYCQRVVPLLSIWYAKPDYATINMLFSVVRTGELSKFSNRLTSQFKLPERVNEAK